MLPYSYSRGLPFSAQENGLDIIGYSRSSTRDVRMQQPTRCLPAVLIESKI